MRAAISPDLSLIRALRKGLSFLVRPSWVLEMQKIPETNSLGSICEMVRRARLLADDGEGRAGFSEGMGRWYQGRGRLEGSEARK